MTDNDLIRLSYASTSAFTERGGGTAIDPEVDRILHACKINNPEREIGGVLHYGYGCFFQVLEGPRDEVQDIYARIAQDSRHTNVATLEKRSVTRRSFPDWSMKYVPLEKNVERSLERHGLKTFDPYQFDNQIIEDVIDLLVGSAAPEQVPDQNRSGGSGGPISFLKRLFGREGKRA
jgi:hypothetical protein